jgi:hypothetical protein
MKKITFGILLLTLVTVGYSQEAGRSNAIKLNPLSLAFLTGNLQYERAVGASSSVQLGLFYSGFKLSGLKYSGLGVTPEVNFSLEETDVDNKTTFTTIGGGATIGWEKTWNSGFVLDIFAGPSYNSAKFKNDADEEEFDVKGGFTGFGIRTGITLGFAF